MIASAVFCDGRKASPKYIAAWAKGLGRRYSSQDDKMIPGAAENVIGIISASIFFCQKKGSGFDFIEGASRAINGNRDVMTGTHFSDGSNHRSHWRLCAGAVNNHISKFFEDVGLEATISTRRRHYTYVSF